LNACLLAVAVAVQDIQRTTVVVAEAVVDKLLKSF
jgi:hypothetical protein